jgi:hypothetical protein
MITFIKPENLNGAELRAELNAVGIKISDAPESVTIDENGNLVLDINADDEAKAISVVAAHNGTTIAPDYSSAKTALLERLGITEEEAKLFLA